MMPIFCQHQIFHATGRRYEKNFTPQNYILQSLLWNKRDSAEVLTWQA